jgi:hypothetical protein
MNRTNRPTTRKCRNWLTSSRIRRQMFAERLAQQWNEIRLCATIERDSVKLSRLAAELDKRKRQETLPANK